VVKWSSWEVVKWAVAGAKRLMNTGESGGERGVWREQKVAKSRHNGTIS